MKDSKQVSLFINSATKALQFGVMIGDEQILRVNMGNPKTALERTHLGIRVLLEQLHLSLKDVDAFYCLLGPGSNTGIRLGLTIPRTVYAFNPNIRIYGIKTMDLLLAGKESGNAVLSDRNGNLFLATKKDGKVETIRVDKKDIPTIDADHIIVEKKDTVAVSELDGKELEKIDVLTQMIERNNDFEDYSAKEEEFLPEYIMKI